MKNILRIRNLAAVSLLVMAPLFSSAQSNGASQQPAPYPTPNFTGNSEQDIRQHDQAVEQWKQQENSRNEELNKKTNLSSSNTKKSDKSESRNAQASVSKEPRKIQYVDIPGFPAYIATGNIEADNANYERAKADWMEAHPQEYEAYLNKNKLTNKKFTRPEGK
jgi:hypothetical protein